MPLQRGKDSGTVFRRLDCPTVLIYLIMVFAGMVSIYAASYDFDQASMFSADEFSGKQLRWIGLSLLLGMVKKGMTFSSPNCSSIRSRSRERLSILAGVPVLNRRISIPSSKRESVRWFAACKPFGPV